MFFVPKFYPIWGEYHQMVPFFVPKTPNCSFLPDGSLLQNLQRRHIPKRFAFLLKELLDIHPEKRPSAEKTRSVLADIVSCSITCYVESTLTTFFHLVETSLKSKWGLFFGDSWTNACVIGKSLLPQQQKYLSKGFGRRQRRSPRCWRDHAKQRSSSLLPVTKKQFTTITHRCSWAGNGLPCWSSGAPSVVVRQTCFHSA